MKDVKIVIGANYGDEGKGLMTRHFVLNAETTKPIVVFHNGTAQRGHTVDYDATHRHVFHHFGSGTKDGAPTYFAETFLIHPMEFRREMCEELIPSGIIPPVCFCHPKAKVITPLDMVVDHATEEWIAKINGEPEFGSCGYGSWCAAEDRLPLGRTAYTIEDWASANKELFTIMMEEVWKDCLSILIERGVDIEKTIYAHILKDRSHLIENFRNDVLFFTTHVKFRYFTTLWERFDSFVFENGQGLGLDMNVDNDWHTTSNTGIINPYNMLKDKNDFNAEVCYVTRSYLTRHGVGPMESLVRKKDINAEMFDRTNVPNDFQGSLRYGYYDDNAMKERIAKDSKIFENDNRFKKSLAITHTNEFDCEHLSNATYVSDNPYTVDKNE